jgi:formate C-acetyltransferase
MAGILKYAEPHYTLRVNSSTPKWLLLKAFDTNRKVGGGQPQFMSDDRVINGLVKQGEDLEDARDWAGNGCVYALSPGFVGDRHITISHAKILELTLNNGVDPRTGKQLGLTTGDPRGFSSFEGL